MNQMTTVPNSPPAGRAGARITSRGRSGTAGASPFLFVGTFLAAWLVLDRLVTSPPLVGSSLLALGVSAGVLLLSERWVTGRPLRGLAERLGLGRPVPSAVVAALGVGVLIVATFVGGAAVLGIDLQLRSNWPVVLAGAFLFHGLAEELVWRGYVFGHLRRGRRFGRAILLSTPLIALTHVPIIVTDGIGIGSLAVLTAAVTCLPFAHLYDRGGRTIWPPAIVHGVIGTWQLFERTYPMTFSMLILCGSIVTPFAAFLYRGRSATAPVGAVAPAGNGTVALGSPEHRPGRKDAR